MKENTKKLAEAMTKRLATHKVNNEDVRNVAARLAEIQRLPEGVDVCILGFCTEHRIKPEELDVFVDKLRAFDLGGIRIFPLGIIQQDDFRVEVDHIAGRL